MVQLEIQYSNPNKAEGVEGFKLLLIILFRISDLGFSAYPYECMPHLYSEAHSPLTIYLYDIEVEMPEPSGRNQVRDLDENCIWKCEGH